MPITTYTTFDSIRAVLGVSAKEAKDESLGLPLFESQFLLEMADVDGGVGAVMAQYNVIAAITPATRTSLQKQLFDIVNMIAAYSVARSMLTGISLAAPQKITDGKAAVERFDTDNFDKVRQGVTGTYGQLLRRLKAVMVQLVPGVNIAARTDRIYGVGVGLGTDPVTGV
jgi:hypothetical protein